MITVRFVFKNEKDMKAKLPDMFEQREDPDGNVLPTHSPIFRGKKTLTILGVKRKPTGKMVEDIMGVEVEETVAVEGWHADILCSAEEAEVYGAMSEALDFEPSYPAHSF